MTDAIRESRARDVYAKIDDVTTPYEPLFVIVSVIVGFRNLSNIGVILTLNLCTPTVTFLWTFKNTWTLGQPQMFQWKAHNHVLIHSHLPIWHPCNKPDQLDPLVKNYMKTNALSTIFTRYGKPNVDEPFNYRYTKVIIHDLWISTIELSISIIES